jgi:hypothetical protein
MLISQPDLQLLPAVLVLLGPFRIIFPIRMSDNIQPMHDAVLAYFKISLFLMMRLTSWIIAELTHTIQTPISIIQNTMDSSITHSLYG